MPNDLLTYKVLAAELSDLLLDGRIQKITMPERDEVRFSVHKNGNFTLVTSVNPNAPSIRISDDKKDNPFTAPAFCMLLRKHLLGSNLTGIKIFSDDRIFALSFTGKTEMRDISKLTLYIELMGRYSNLILCDVNDRVLDSLIHIGFEAEAKRVIMPGITYRAPEKSDKAELYEYDKIAEKLHDSQCDNLTQSLLKNVNGLSKNTAAEIAFRANETADEAISIIKDFNEIYKSKIYNPCTLNDYSDYFVTPYHTLSDADGYKFFPTVNGAANACLTRTDNKIRKENYAKETLTLVKRYRNKLVKKIGFARDKLSECENMENARLFGELLTANLYRIKKGEKEVLLENYYNEMRTVKIPMDVAKTPQQNAAAYYNKYNKLKRAKEFSEKQIVDYTTQLNYINSVYEALSRAEISDVEDIKTELVNLKIIKKQSGKKGVKNQTKSAPKCFECDDFKIYVGTNNVLNNEVTFTIGRSFDIWLHVKDHHGSHVIIRKNNEADVVPESVLIAAAETAAFYSEASASQNVAVDFTERKFVRRIKDAGLGMVNYTNFKTLFVNPKDNV